MENDFHAWFGLLCLLFTLIARAQGYEVAPAPSWVVSVLILSDAWSEIAPGSNGEAYVLV